MNNILYIQSGGPTSVINASAYGVIKECRLNKDKIGKIFTACYGIHGVLMDEIIELTNISDDELEILKVTPSMAFGSSRYQIDVEDPQEKDFKQILNTINKYDIEYLIFNGGDGTLNLSKYCNKFFIDKKCKCKVLVIPKTVDNDIGGIAYSPGFPSAARYVINSIMELSHDIRSYDTPLITVIEVMGRNTGWLAAASLLCSEEGNGPDLIYVPETSFIKEQFINDVRGVISQKNKCIIVVSEGIKDKNGNYFTEKYVTYDNPYINLGGVGSILSNILRDNFECKIRSVDLGLLQRCSISNASQLDLTTAEQLGRNAVNLAINNVGGKMLTVKRNSENSNLFTYDYIDIDESINTENNLPIKYITKENNFIEKGFLDYIKPLVGEFPKYYRMRV